MTGVNLNHNVICLFIISHIGSQSTCCPRIWLTTLLAQFTAKRLIGTVLLSFLLIQAWWLVYLLLNTTSWMFQIPNCLNAFFVHRAKRPFLTLIQFYRYLDEYEYGSQKCCRRQPGRLLYFWPQWTHGDPNLELQVTETKKTLPRLPVTILLDVPFLVLTYFYPIIQKKEEQLTYTTLWIWFNREVLSTMKMMIAPHLLCFSWWSGCPQPANVDGCSA